MNRPSQAEINAGGLIERFPVLRRIGSRTRARRIPVVLQMNIVECGPASLCMVLGYHGKQLPLHVVRDALDVDRDGASALSLLTAARAYGLRARGVRVDVDDLPHLPTASILHWEFNHFLVFERHCGDHIVVVDPACGRRRIGLEEVRRSFTGVALEFEPQSDFARTRMAAMPAWQHLGRALLAGAEWSKIFVASLIVQLCALSVPAVTGTVVDKVVPRDDLHLLTVASVGLAAVVGFNFIASMARAHLLLQMRSYLDVRMALGFLEHLVRLPFEFFQKRSAGDILMRLDSNTAIRDILTNGVLSAALDGTLVCLYLVLLFLLSPLMGAVTLSLGALQLLLFAVTHGRRRELMGENLHVQARQASYQVEILAGIEALKSMGLEQGAVERWTNRFVDSQNVAIERGRLSAAVDSCMSTLRLASPLIVLVTGATLVLDGELSLGVMLALNALAVGFLTPLSALVTTAEQFELLSSYVQRLDDVFGHAQEQGEREGVVAPPLLSGQIRLEHVSFRYGDRGPLVVEDVSLDIAPGRFVAIVGPSGCGKSTLASLLVGMYSPIQGRILYDQRDLKTLELGKLRQQLGVVVQRPYVFGATVRENIALSKPDAALEEVRWAAQVAQLDDEIMALPMGYETIVNGATLSGGQRQRISLARALLRKPPIMLLDEATSALDSITEARIRRAIDQIGCTRIVLAHRLSTIVHADLILVMHEGKVIERGTHAELVARGGAYHALVEAQREDGAAPATET